MSTDMMDGTQAVKRIRTLIKARFGPCWSVCHERRQANVSIYGPKWRDGIRRIPNEQAATLAWLLREEDESAGPKGYVIHGFYVRYTEYERAVSELEYGRIHDEHVVAQQRHVETMRRARSTAERPYVLVGRNQWGKQAVRSCQRTRDEAHTEAALLYAWGWHGYVGGMAAEHLQASRNARATDAVDGLLEDERELAAVEQVDEPVPQLAQRDPSNGDPWIVTVRLTRAETR